jgi:hypothetical protein
LQQDLEGLTELEARLEDLAAAEDIETKSCSGKGDRQTADIAEVADAGGTG